MPFEKIKIIHSIRKAVAREGYTAPTPIQEKAIPIILEGRDLVGCAQTGTGKTAAFAIPILQKLDELHQKDIHSDSQKDNGMTRKIRALILTPTRELALQIDESFAKYGRYLDLRNTVVFGGVSQDGQVSALNNGVDILVATPGRLLDLIWQKYIDFGDVRILVLDEADRMLDMGFAPDVQKIIELLPEKRQNLLFSATMPREIEALVDSILTDPVKVAVDPVSSTVDTVEQLLYYVSRQNKTKLLINLLKTEDIETALVFTRTKHGADRTADDLKKANIRADVIHGDKTQSSREHALNNFKRRKVRVLVATEIVARGLDIDELSHVINFDVPNVPESYVHRIGRTARAGLGGVAITLCDKEEKKYIAGIEKLIGKTLTVVEDHPYPMDGKIIHLPKPAFIQHKQEARTGNEHKKQENTQKLTDAKTGYTQKQPVVSPGDNKKAGPQGSGNREYRGNAPGRPPYKKHHSDQSGQTRNPNYTGRPGAGPAKPIEPAPKAVEPSAKAKPQAREPMIPLHKRPAGQYKSTRPVPAEGADTRIYTVAAQKTVQAKNEGGESMSADGSGGSKSFLKKIGEKLGISVKK
ncbi:MAG: DEAD/DEAH box helicase [Clostridia bacterium]|nr:DEAD/DEAH box helicase [Clostridia bacterium]